MSLQGCGGADGGLVECHSILVYDWCAGGAGACFIVKLCSCLKHLKFGIRTNENLDQ